MSDERDQVDVIRDAIDSYLDDIGNDLEVLDTQDLAENVARALGLVDEHMFGAVAKNGS